MVQYVFEKELSPQTIEALYAMAQDFTKDYFVATYPDEVRVELQFHRAFYMTVDGEIASAIVYTCLEGGIFITLMMTARRYKGSGCGSQLMSEFVKHVSEYGLNSIELYTVSPETSRIYAATVAFYEKNGFEVVRAVRGLWGLTAVTIVMRREW